MARPKKPILPGSGAETVVDFTDNVDTIELDDGFGFGSVSEVIGLAAQVGDDIKRAPVERKTETPYQKGKPVFLLDDPDGKVWVMKAF